jgi:drug/metabolite transporter (DMT)-like permease
MTRRADDTVPRAAGGGDGDKVAITSRAAMGSRLAGSGLGIAVLSSAAFGLSGPLAKSLLDAGWSAGAAVLLRLAGAAAVLAVPTVLMLRGRWQVLRSNAGGLLLYGIVAVAGLQICFFNAVRHLSVGVALMIEYLAPVIIIFFHWWQARRPPGRLTRAGAGLAIIGMVFVVGVGGSVSIDLVGVAWGLAAAICLSFYFVMAAHQRAELPPLLLTTGGMTIGAIAVAIAAAVGIVPLAVSSAHTALAFHQTSWLVPAVLLVTVPTVLAYLTGIAAAGRLGAKVASFVALTEVLFAVLAAWLLLGEWPHLLQLFGGACIVGGVVLVKTAGADVPATAQDAP